MTRRILATESAHIIAKALSHGFLVDTKAFDLISRLPPEIDAGDIVERVIQRKRSDPKADRVITKENVEELLPAVLATETRSVLPVEPVEAEVEVIVDPTNRVAPIEADEGYKKLFKDRYERLVGIVKRRPDTRGVTGIQAIKGLPAGGKAKLAALVSSRTNKRGSVELVLDDPSGSLRLSCQDERVVRAAQEIPLDSLVVAEVSRSRAGQLYVNSLTLPDIPDKRPVLAGHTVYAVMLSDLHVGSRMFLREDFQRFILWLNGKLGDEEIVNRIKYLVIAGDLVDGVGVYPGQEAQLSEIDLRKQYILASQFIEQVPRHLEVLISPGNHDAVRQALPQPAVSVELAEALYKMENVRWVGNPALLRLHGVSLLVYHGKSLDDVIATTPALSYKRPTAAMELLLRAIHLAPHMVRGRRFRPRSMTCW
jgi:DNA polymerase II small subunit